MPGPPSAAPDTSARPLTTGALDASPPADQVVRVPDGGLTVAARDAVTIASEADSLVLTAATEIVLNVGHSTFTLRADGTILLNGKRMTLVAPTMIDLNPDVPGGTGPAAPPPRPCGCDESPTPDAP